MGSCCSSSPSSPHKSPPSPGLQPAEDPSSTRPTIAHDSLQRGTLSLPSPLNWGTAVSSGRPGRRERPTVTLTATQYTGDAPDGGLTSALHGASTTMNGNGNSSSILLPQRVGIIVASSPLLSDGASVPSVAFDNHGGHSPFTLHHSSSTMSDPTNTHTGASAFSLHSTSVNPLFSSLQSVEEAINEVSSAAVGSQRGCRSSMFRTQRPPVASRITRAKSPVAASFTH